MTGRPAIRTALRIAVIYGLFSTAWILASDRLLQFFVTSPGELTWLQTVKGSLFILLSSFLIYGLLRRELIRQEELRRDLAESRDLALVGERMKSSLLANMSHEIRTPLNVLTGYLELLREEMQGGRPGSAEFFEGVERATSRLLDTLAKILDMAKLESGTVELSPETIDLPAEVERTIATFSQHADEKGLALRWENAVGAVRVRFDEYCLRAAIQNLVDNAIKFTPEGAVTVKLTTHGGGEIVLEVADTGVGIPRHYLTRIFAPFSQQQDDSGRPFEGSGLGLAITKRFVEANGASISVDTEVGKGSRFAIRFPRGIVAS